MKISTFLFGTIELTNLIHKFQLKPSTFIIQDCQVSNESQQRPGANCDHKQRCLTMDNILATHPGSVAANYLQVP